MKLYFLSDKILPNYLIDSDFYSYMDYDEIKNHELRKKLFDFSCSGKYIHTNYIYWICKNNGFDVELINNVDNIPEYSTVFFHYDFYNLLSRVKNLRLIQILSDKPIIPNSNFYLSNSKSFVNSNKLKNCFYLPEPIPAKNLNSSSNKNVEAKNFRFLGLRKNFPSFLSDNLILDLKKKNIFIIKEFSKNYIEENDDIIFFLRDEKDLLFNKHANRVFLSYINESPYISNLSEDEKLFLVKKDDAINISYNKDSLIDAMIFLKNNSNFLKYKSKLNVNKESFKHHFLNNFTNVINCITSQKL